ncbi:hypothetical protein HPP92_005488 [Vanilla planifolia]|uniref:Nodulation signaling pathway 2-like protein n=1 Tax=Vanilla planifolia TaxID=51239 RepID=A0A835RNL0_VANPL|nr:hypothetical protein HPP92_005847 [Vanilla planifolia]KAG0494494.1 hypothetical protein HPP92_005488 [Vanilla planifolia]
MEVAMDSMMEMDNFGCGFAIDGELGWSSWSPGIDWEYFPAADDFHGLIESMINDGADRGGYGLPEFCDGSVTVSASSTNTPNTPTGELATVGTVDDEMGLRLLHLLIAAAEALTGVQKCPELAHVILARLKELLARGGESSMERLAAYFTDALQGLLDGGRQQEDPPPNPGELLKAFHLLQGMSPCVKFGHLTANQAIVEAVADQRRVHIVDYDIAEGAQWASLMQALVTRKDGQSPPLPPPHLRITAVTRCGAGRRSVATIHDTGRRLAAFAASVGLSFSFGQCRLDSDEQFRPAAVKLFKGEALVLNCVINPPHLPRRSAVSVRSFLASAPSLGARLVTVVEEEGGGGKGDEGRGFVGLFMAELQRYSAIWDSLEARFPMQGRARGVVDRLIMGPRITEAVETAYRRREEGSVAWEGWGKWLEAVGFGRVVLSFFNLCQAKLLLGLFDDGYRVEEEAPNKLVLYWKNCSLLSVSVWSAPPPSSPSPSPSPSPSEASFPKHSSI